MFYYDPTYILVLIGAFRGTGDVSLSLSFVYCSIVASY